MGCSVFAQRAQLIIQMTHIHYRLPSNYVPSLSAFCKGYIRNKGFHIQFQGVARMPYLRRVFSKRWHSSDQSLNAIFHFIKRSFDIILKKKKNFCRRNPQTFSEKFLNYFSNRLTSKQMYIKRLFFDDHLNLLKYFFNCFK